MTNRIQGLGLLATLLVASFIFPQYSQAQTKPEIGQAVKVNIEKEWRDAKIIDTNKKKYLVETTGEEPARFVLDRFSIRLLYETEALDFSRTWVSSNGTYKVIAALKTFDGTTVTLIKTDNSTIEVALDKFSAKDISYVKNLKRKKDAAIASGSVPGSFPKLPEMITMETRDDLTTLENIRKRLRTDKGFPPNSQPLEMRDTSIDPFLPAGFAIPKSNELQKICGVFPIGGPEKIVLLATTVDNRPDAAQFPAQLFWISLLPGAEKLISTVNIPPNSYPIDYDPVSQRLLTLRCKNEKLKIEHSSLALWKLNIGEPLATPVVHWKNDITSPPRSVQTLLGQRPIFAKIVDANTVVIREETEYGGIHSTSRFRAWDLTRNRIAYDIPLSPGGLAIAELSADRRYLSIPEVGQIRVFDAKTGEKLLGLGFEEKTLVSQFTGALKTQEKIRDEYEAMLFRMTDDIEKQKILDEYMTRIAPKLNDNWVRYTSDTCVSTSIDPRGTKLAAINTRKTLFVWDLSNGQTDPTEFKTIEVSSGAIQWIGTDHLLITTREKTYLYSFRLGATIWTFERARAPNYLFPGGEAFDSYTVKHTGATCIYTTKNDKVMAVGVVPFPGEGIYELAETYQRPDILDLQPGTNVAIELINIDDSQRVKSILSEKIKAKGWILDPNAEVKITATLDVEEKKREYTDPLSGDTISISWKYPTAQLTIQRGEGYKNQLFYAYSGLTIVPTMSPEQAQLYEAPRIDFLENVEFDEIVDKKYANGFGSSSFGPTGLKVLNSIRPLSSTVTEDN